MTTVQVEDHISHMGYNFRGAARSGSFWEAQFSLVLAAILNPCAECLALWAGHSVWIDDQKVHGQPLEYGTFWVWFIWEYNISLVADTFGVILIVLLSKRLKRKAAQNRHTTNRRPA